MARKPNYRFERHERERTRAAKKAERAKVKAERAEKAKATTTNGEPEPGRDEAGAPPGADPQA